MGSNEVEDFQVEQSTGGWWLVKATAKIDGNVVYLSSSDKFVPSKARASKLTETDAYSKVSQLMGF